MKPKAAAPKPSKAKAEKPKKKVAPAANAVQDKVTKWLDQDKGDNIVSISLSGKSSLADYMVIVSGTSSRHIASMAQKLRDRLENEGYKNVRIEGAAGGDWVILDANDIIVHFFRPEVRTFYNLEKLWGADFSAVDYTLYHSA